MALKTLLDAEARHEILGRAAKLSPESPRRWGKMTVGQMLCHLNDTYLCAMGERPAEDVSSWFSRTVLKFGGLQVPMPWPHGLKTLPEFDQLAGGTPPEEFQRDRERLEVLIERFTRPAGKRDFEFGRHPMFAEMTEWEWMRWGYLHADHHFRQFGV